VAVVAGRSNGTSHGFVPGEPVKFPTREAELALEEEARRIILAVRTRMMSPQDGVRAIVRLVEERSKERER
jgi:hypothetical protein